MIKRRFYKVEHGEGNDPSSGSSSDSESSSRSEGEVEATQESEDAALVGADDEEDSGSSASGYRSGDRLVNEVDADLSVAASVQVLRPLFVGNDSIDIHHQPGIADYADEDDRMQKVREEPGGFQLADQHGPAALEKESDNAADDEPMAADLPAHILKFKSVYRCRICPKTICLTEATMRAHIASKKHARSEKLLNENKLREMLNSDGKVENQETAAELHARVVALAQGKSKNNKKGQEQQAKRSIDKKVGDDSNSKKTKGLKTTPAKRRRKNES